MSSPSATTTTADHSDDGTKVMGAIVGGYLACVVCCTGCCVVGSALLLWTGAACLSQSAGECGRAGAYAMLLFGALPPLGAVSAQLYLLADARGWCRPRSVPPGGHGARRMERQAAAYLTDDGSMHAPLADEPRRAG